MLFFFQNQTQGVFICRGARNDMRHRIPWFVPASVISDSSQPIGSPCMVFFLPMVSVAKYTSPMDTYGKWNNSCCRFTKKNKTCESQHIIARFLVFRWNKSDCCKVVCKWFWLLSLKCCSGPKHLSIYIYRYIPLKRPNNFFQKLRCLMPKTKQQQKKWHVWLYGSSTLHVNDVVFICPVMRTPVFGGVLSLPLTVFCGYFVAPQRSWSLPFPSNGGSDHDLSAW